MMDLSKPEAPAELHTAVPAQERFAAALRSFGPLGILAILAVIFSPTAIIGAILVVLWVVFSRTPWGELGFVRPKSWVGPVAIGLAGGVAFKLVMKAVVMPLLGAAPINQTYHYLVGNPVALLKMAAFVIIGGGLAEETVFRGFLFERLSKLLGPSGVARASTVLLTAAWFALLHYFDQGIAGVEQATITGLVFGTIFAITRRIWMLMIAHAAFDLVALAIIYWNLELKVAHWIFK